MVGARGVRPPHTRRADPVPQPLRPPTETSAPDYALSANGTLVYVPAGNDGSSASTLVWVDRGGRVVGAVVDDRIDHPREPRRAPDSRRVLVTTGPATTRDLWIYDLAGRPPIPLVDEGDNAVAVWSHDGRQVALTRGNGATSDSYRVYRIPSDGCARDSELVSAEPGQVAAWSAEDELILNLRNGDISKVSVGDSGRAREIVATADIESDASLSPDDRWLAYTSDRTGRLEVFDQSYDAIAAFESRSYDVAADGRFLMIQPADAGSVVVIENWTEELKRLVPTE